MSALGTEDGATCNRNGCAGVLKYPPVENCGCHISPPCSRCVDNPLTCPECGWQEEREYILNDYVVREDRKTGVLKSWEPRPLDNTKIDWHSKSHTHFTMIKEGVYPPDMTQEQVGEAVKGTFGGRFEYFGGGRFKYIAYTD